MSNRSEWVLIERTHLRTLLRGAVAYVDAIDAQLIPLDLLARQRGQRWGAAIMAARAALDGPPLSPPPAPKASGSVGEVSLALTLDTSDFMAALDRLRKVLTEAFPADSTDE